MKVVGGLKVVGKVNLHHSCERRPKTHSNVIGTSPAPDVLAFRDENGIPMILGRFS